MTKGSDDRPAELTQQDLQDANGEELPERHAMTLIRGFEPLPLPVIPDDSNIPIDDPHPT